MIRYLYTVLLALLSPVLLFGLYKKKADKPRFGARWKEHFGRTPVLADTSAQPIWIHTVSVGETIAATPFVQALKQQYPNIPIVITTTTSTGAEQAEKLSAIAEHRYMPLDFSFAVKGFIKTIRPQIMLIMETELWPNTLHHTAKSGIPTIVINARLSERSALRYQTFQAIFNLLAQHIDKVLCQHKDDADRFVKLGLSRERVSVTGSLKFDIDIADSVITSGNALRQQLGQERSVWIAASTHHGEDEQVLIAHKTILKHDPTALLILVPRHPERFNDVHQRCMSQGFHTARRTQASLNLEHTQVYLADTMGEMLVLLAASDVCFMGGSLIGNKVGGHNLLEPAALGLPCIIGPSYYNFTDVTEQLTQAKAALICQNTHELTLQVKQLFANEQERNQYGERALAVVNRNKGAVQKTVNAIKLPSP